MRTLSLTFLLLSLSSRVLCGQAPVPVPPALQQDLDPELYAHILLTPAVDNHAHPVLPPPADATDRNFDALPVDNMEPETDIVAWRPDNPELPAALHALWGFTAPDPFLAPLSPNQQKALAAARALIKQREGAHFDQWVLDQANIGSMLANRVTMDTLAGQHAPGSTAPRFRWVPYVDALLFPFSNAQLKAQTPDKALFYPLEEKLRTRYLDDVGLNQPPANLDDYLAHVVTPTLEHQHAAGAVAEKFEVAYLRSFDFTNPSLDDARRAYAEGARTPADYKLLQDFLFRYIARESGRIGMAVHLHTMSGGGGYFSIAGGNPLLLESVFNDPTLRHTHFVMLHGGWPFVREAGSLLQKPNVFLDLSQQALTFPPRTLAGWLREWLETFPDKILFGTDGYPFTDALGWEESTWIAARRARIALALALTGMLRDGELSRPQAMAVADQVLHGNAERLYAAP